ncbi:hypothetical protein ACWOFR_18210 [Carnobacterium gallinarum]|uniref:hypothetical protein n=1 Tax=Carnobacterium gallinarum TaxID=2749 RepID=UPI00054F4D8B|nr:hypothetical protein [Carnobacterium gallinarum]
MLTSTEQITHKLNDTKKEIDRLADRRSEQLANPINYVENELKIANLQGQITGYEEALRLLES